jgi:Glycosyl transferase family 2
MTKPRITVLIPTRERCDVLRFSLQTVVAQDYDNLEIVVSDNHSQDETRDVIAAMGDSRIRYVNTGKRLAMTANWEFALSHANAGWVTFMGDDDGFPPGAIARIADIAESSAAQAIRTRAASYVWPAAAGKEHGELIVPMSSGVEMRDCARWLRKSLSGLAKYTELPLIYNGGFVHTDALKKMMKGDACLLSSIPDVYTSVALASVLERYAYCHEPLAINGTSAHSTGTSLFSTEKTRNAAPGSRFKSEGNIPFHDDIPLNADGSIPLSLHALVYECYLQSQSLRPEGSRESHARQLEIIMASDTAHLTQVREWGQRFSHLHGLDYGKALRGAATRRLLLGPNAFATKTWRAANSIIVDTPHVPITDVYQASIAVATIRSRPRRRDSLPHLIKARLSGGIPAR